MGYSLGVISGSNLTVWLGLAALGWVWLIVGDLRTGHLGWSFARLDRAKQPRAFWTAFAAQHAVIAMCLLMIWRP